MGGGLRGGIPSWALKDVGLVEEGAGIPGKSSWDPEYPARGKGLKKKTHWGWGVGGRAAKPFHNRNVTTHYLLLPAKPREGRTGSRSPRKIQASQIRTLL